MVMRVPLRALVSRCTPQQNCPLRARIQPQLVNRCVKISPPRGAEISRRFGTTSFLREKKYTKDHEWIELSDDGKTGTIGISTYAAKQLGDVVYVELPELSLEVSQGDTIGAVESVKSASDINTPVSGKIVETNETLMEKPGGINKGPEGEEGWIAKVEVTEKGNGELVTLMEAAEYEKFTAEE